MNNHSLQNTEGEPSTRGTTAAHTQGTLYTACSYFTYTEKHKVSCSGFNIHAAITMQFAASRG